MTVTFFSLTLVLFTNVAPERRLPLADERGRPVQEKGVGGGSREGQDAVKEKNGRVVVKDKSKPVRTALEVEYGRLAEAVQNKDWEAFQALRTEDFHTVDERGRPQSPEQMAQRARAMLARIQAPIKTTNTIGTIEVEGKDAKATVRQYFSRRQEIAGRVRKLETYVTQDETWTQKAGGWKLKFVDNVRDAETYVDGKRIDPTKPYDPDAPPYVPPPAPGGKAGASGK